MKIAVIGMGYVGLSLATLLSKDNEVVAVDIDESRVDMVNSGKSPIVDKLIEEYLAKGDLNITATTSYAVALDGAEYVIVCTPTNYDVETGKFDTSSVEAALDQARDLKSNAAVVIKSTIPVGYTNQIRKKYPSLFIFFSPEFLREGRALEDNLYPSRIVVGSEDDRAVKFGELLKESALKDDVKVVAMESTEAEAVKLFANTYLAMRVSYFNELDTFAEIHDLNSRKIIEAVCLDPRIGMDYCNPSFGYGGYCLPKDTKQLRANYKEKKIPQKMIEATVEANKIRKNYIAYTILSKNPDCIGIYRLTMKKDSDNYRESAIQDIIRKFVENDANVIIYEPTFKGGEYLGCEVINDFEAFMKKSDIVLANRFEPKLHEYSDKIYTRDMFEKD